MKTDVLIFSKDRACQLDLLLTSMQKLATGLGTITALYKASEECFNQAYQTCKSSHGNVNFLEEKDFHLQVVEWLQDPDRSLTVMFLVDDDVFKLNFDFGVIPGILQQNPQISCYSSKLGLHLGYCYPLNLPQKVPNGQVINEFFVWNWRESEHDWQYIFSVDGHVFRTSEISSWVSCLSFHNPNSFEAAMQNIQNHFVIPPYAICRIKSQLINIPMNRVQDTYANRCGNVSHVELNEQYAAGRRLQHQPYEGMLNFACHEDVPAVWR